MQQLVRSIRARTLFPRADDIWQSGDLLSSHRTYKYLWWRRVLLEFMMAIFFAFFGAVFVDFGWLALLADLAWVCPAGIYSYFIIYHALYEAPEQHTYIFAFIISNCLWPSVKMPHKTTRKWQNCKLQSKKLKKTATNLFPNAWKCNVHDASDTRWRIENIYKLYKSELIEFDYSQQALGVDKPGICMNFHTRLRCFIKI